MSGQVLPDISKLIEAEVAKANARLEAKVKALEAENQSLRTSGQGVAIAWAKDKEGKALALTWPGKRSRYIEVAEFHDLRGKVGEQIEAFIKGK